MATIKKGTYRWNDELTMPTTIIDGFPRVQLELPFIVNTVHPLGELTANCSYIEFTSNTETTVAGHYIIETSSPNLNDLGLDYPYQAGVYNGYYGGWQLDAWGEGVQYITVTADTVVEDEAFATWFTTNTKEVKAISGKRRFKDTLTQSNPQLNVAVNFTFELINVNYDAGEVYTETITANGLIQEPYFEGRENIGALWYNFGGENFADYQGIYLWDSKGWKVHYLGQTREQISETLILAMPDIDETTLNYYLDELYKCYGEGIKTVDFGTVPQYIPVDAHDWIMENTEPVGAEATPAVEITYKGETIFLSAGQTITLHTANKKLTDDIIISV